MSENNAYKNENKEQRLKRFRGDPIEIIETMLASIERHFNNEIGATINDPKNQQTLLMLLGIHAVALTLSYGFFGKEKKAGYKIFLEHYIDGDSPDKKFSTIASELHDWRNVIAHRWLNVLGFEIGYNYNMLEGWIKDGDIIYINPAIYLKQYLRAFNRREGGMLYRYKEILNTNELLEAARQRFLSKYTDHP